MSDFKEDNGKSRVGMFLSKLGEKAAPLAKMGLSIAAGVTGIKQLEDLSHSIRTSSQLDEEEKETCLSLLGLDTQDRADARKSNTEIQKSEFSSWMSKNVPYLLDMFIMLIWGAMTVFIVAKAMNLISDTTIDWTAILGIYSGVTGMATLVMSFHRGSSQGSKDKADVLSRVK